MPRDHQRCGELLLSAAHAFGQTRWQPSVDAYRTARGWLLKYELAGVLPREVEVIVHGRTVTACAAVAATCGSKRGSNRTAWRFRTTRSRRSLELPCDLSTMHVTTDYRDGMLVVWLNCKVPGE